MLRRNRSSTVQTFFASCAGARTENAAVSRSVRTMSRTARITRYHALCHASSQAVPRIVGMALTATIYNIEIDLADHDRGVFESLAMRAARHPSESEEYFVTR